MLVTKNNIIETTGLSNTELSAIVNIGKDEVATFNSKGETALYNLKSIIKLLRDKTKRKELGLSTPAEIYEALNQEGLLTSKIDGTQLMTEQQVADLVNREARKGNLKCVTTTISRAKNKKSNKELNHKLFRTNKTVDFVLEYIADYLQLKFTAPVTPTLENSSNISNVIAIPEEDNLSAKLEALKLEVEMLKTQNLTFKNELRELFTNSEIQESSISSMQTYIGKSQRSSSESRDLITVDRQFIQVYFDRVYTAMKLGLIELSDSQERTLQKTKYHLDSGKSQVTQSAYGIVMDNYTKANKVLGTARQLTI